MSEWVDICSKDEIDEEDLITRKIGKRTYAVYHSPDGEFFCTDGHCTHEDVDLGDGLVMDYEIECPKHNARFDYRTGEVLSAPACVNLNTYEVRVSGDRIEIKVGA